MSFALVSSALLSAFLTGQVDPRLFYIQALGDRCVDSAIRDRVVIRPCKDNNSQKFIVHEVNASHDIQLQVPYTNLCVGVLGSVVSLDQYLDLQTCSDSPAQMFAFDGDALLVGRQNTGERVSREFVIEPRDGVTNENTPIVVGERDVNDAEYWRMIPVDGSDRRPHSGFVEIISEFELEVALPGSGWGSVLELNPPGGQIILESMIAGVVREGVTLRGGAKLTSPGALLRVANSHVMGFREPIFTTEDRARITGLRLRGNYPEVNDEDRSSYVAVLLGQSWGLPPVYNVILDHADISHFYEAGVQVVGVPHQESEAETLTCPQEKPRSPSIVNIIGSVIRNNHGQYGVSVGAGGRAFMKGDVFFDNDHDVTCDPHARNEYYVEDSLFTDEGEAFGINNILDVHGHCDAVDFHYKGGRAGGRFEAAFNTFLSSRTVVNVRGTPCESFSFHDNVMTRDGDALKVATDPGEPKCKDANGIDFIAGDHDDILVKANNRLDYPDPTRTFDGHGELAAGDFDGDGLDDVFLGTETTWWYSSGGVTYWQLMNRMPERASELRFADLDYDGRTDVIAVHGQNIDVSWAGGSPWITINTIDPALDINDLAVGDFDADGRADLFAADGQLWTWSSHGTAPWDFFAFSGYRTHELRFGDFTSDGRTDVFGIEGGRWKIVDGPFGSWAELGDAQSTDIDTLVVADFDGDSIADVAHYDDALVFAEKWYLSRSGTLPFVHLRDEEDRITRMPIGRFDEYPGADVILWGNPDSRYLHLVSSATGGRLLWSRQSMR